MTLTDRKTALQATLKQAQEQLAQWSQIALKTQAKLELLDELEPDQPDPKPSRARAVAAAPPAPNGEALAGD